MTDTITLEPKIGDETVSVLGGSVPHAPNPDIALERSMKMDFALGKDAPAPGVTYDSLLSGREQVIRDQVAINEDIAFQEEKLQIVDNQMKLAAKEGRTLTRAEEAAMWEVTREDVRTDPATVFEKKYAKRVMELAIGNDPENPFAYYVKNDPQTAFLQKGVLETEVAKREIFNRLLQDQTEKASQQSWAGWGADILKTAIPFYSWNKWTNVNPEDVPGWLPGTEKAEIVKDVWSLPPEQAHATARAMIERLNQDNTPLATELAQAFVQYTQDDKFWDNILIPGLDVATVVPLSSAKALLKGATSAVGVAAKASRTAAEAAKTVQVGEVAAQAGKTASEAARASAKFVKDVATAVMRPKAGGEDLMDATGDTVTAALFTNIKNSMPGAMESFDKVRKMVPSVFNPAELLQQGTYISKGTVDSIRKTLEANRDLLIEQVLLKQRRIDNLDGAMLKAAIEEVKDRMARTIGNTANSVLDVSIDDIGLGKDFGNTRMATVKLGAHGGELFSTAADANITAKVTYGLKPGTYTLEEKGNGYVINTRTAVQMDSPSYRKAYEKIVTDNPTDPGNMVAQALMRWRTPEDTLPKELTDAFTIAGLNMAQAKDTVSGIMRQLIDLKLSKDEIAQYDDFTRAQQQQSSIRTPGKIGYTSKTLQDFEQDWFNRFGAAPTDKQAHLYFQNQQLNDFVYAASNIKQFNLRSRSGYSMWSFKHGELLNIEDVEGKIIANLPENINQNVGIMVVKEDKVGSLENVDVYSSLGLGKRPKSKGEEALGVAEEKSPREILRELQKEGYRVIQLSQIASTKLMETPNLVKLLKDKPDVRFILAKTTENSPIPFNSVPYTEGLRFIPNPKSYFISQPVMSSNKIQQMLRYYGDKNLYQASDEATARMLAERFDEARKLFLKEFESGKFPKTKAYMSANLPKDAQRNFMWALKKGMADPRAGVDPRYPILLRKANQSLDSADVKLASRVNSEWGTNYAYERSKDLNIDGYENLGGMRETLERGDMVYRYENKGSLASPLWQRELPDLINPRDAVENMMSGYLRSAVNDDVVFQTAERFIAEFDNVLDPAKKQLYNDPIQTLLDPDIFRKNLQGEDALKVKQANVYRERAIGFLGMMTPETRQHGYFIEKLLGDIDKRFGEGWTKPVVDLLKDYYEGKQNPATQLRSFAFHAKLGMFSPRQLVLQPMTLFRMAAVLGPTSDVTRMTGSALWHMGIVTDRGMLKLNPAINTVLREAGWEKGWFDEVVDLYVNSGQSKVRQSNVLLSDHIDFQVSKTAAGRFLFEDGLMFFEAGEKINRRAAVMGAYLEWRLANKTKPFNAKAQQFVLSRAKLLNSDMGHESRALWQEGWMSIPTQFMAYTVRGMEQMMGKRLTNAEKARIVGVHAAVFGLPISLAGASGFAPVNEMYTNAALAAGYDTNSNAMSSILTDGLLGYATELLAGEPMNISERYGPGAVPTLYDIIFKDEPVKEFLAGPGGSTFASFAGEIAPVVPWLWKAVQGDEIIRPGAVWDALKNNITTLGQIDSAVAALTLGAYYSKRGNELLAEDRDTLQGIFESILNVSPKRVDNIYKMEYIMRKRNEAQAKFRPQMRDEIRQILETQSPDEAKPILEQFKIKGMLSGFTEDQMERLINDEVQGNSRIERTLKNFSKISVDTNLFVKEMQEKYGMVEEETK